MDTNSLELHKPAHYVSRSSTRYVKIQFTGTKISPRNTSLLWFVLIVYLLTYFQYKSPAGNIISSPDSVVCRSWWPLTGKLPLFFIQTGQHPPWNYKSKVLQTSSLNVLDCIITNEGGKWRSGGSAPWVMTPLGWQLMHLEKPLPLPLCLLIEQQMTWANATKSQPPPLPSHKTADALAKFSLDVITSPQPTILISRPGAKGCRITRQKVSGLRYRVVIKSVFRLILPSVSLNECTRWDFMGLFINTKDFIIIFCPRPTSLTWKFHILTQTSSVSISAKADDGQSCISVADAIVSK